MKTNAIAQESGWRVSFWFPVSSPLIGVLLAFLAAAIFLPMIEEAMSLAPINFVLVILLFGFDSAGKSRPVRTYALKGGGRSRHRFSNNVNKSQ